MTRQTKVVWADGVVTPELANIIDSEAQLLKEQGKTDDIKEFLPETPIAGQSTTIRTWIDLETAENWIIFLNSLGVPPVSTEIVPE